MILSCVVLSCFWFLTSADGAQARVVFCECLPAAQVPLPHDKCHSRGPPGCPKQSRIEEEVAEVEVVVVIVVVVLVVVVVVLVLVVEVEVQVVVVVAGVVVVVVVVRAGRVRDGMTSQHAKA